MKTSLPPEILFSGPVPGQSLTRAKESPALYERPPRFTDFEEAQSYLVEEMLKKDAAVEAASLMRKGVPVDALATIYVFSGFSKGLWTPDLMLLLVEPAIYTLLFIAEQSGTNYVLSEDEMLEYIDADDELELAQGLQGLVRKKAKDVEEGEGEIPAGLLAKMGGE